VSPSAQRQRAVGVDTRFYHAQDSPSTQRWTLAALEAIVGPGLATEAAARLPGFTWRERLQNRDELESPHPEPDRGGGWDAPTRTAGGPIEPTLERHRNVFRMLLRRRAPAGGRRSPTIEGGDRRGSVFRRDPKGGPLIEGEYDLSGHPVAAIALIHQ